MKMTDLNHMSERITSQCAEIDGNANLFDRVHLNFARRIKLSIENDGIILKILFINIRCE